MSALEASPGALPILEVRDLVVEYRGRWRHEPVRAVDGASLVVPQGQTVALVGESGSGKTSIGNAILGIAPVTSGSVLLRGKAIQDVSGRARRSLAQDLQAVFQDPYGSLSPTRTIGQTLAEPLRATTANLTSQDVTERSAAMLRRVGLPPDAVWRYPGAFSGGQRQRIAIARALISGPSLVVCDEPTSALDVSIRGQILNLLADLQADSGVSYLFISHDLAAVRQIAMHIVVLFGGRVMEAGPMESVNEHPSHPYTQALLDAVPVADPVLQAQRRRHRTTETVVEQPDTPATDGTGCPFAARCAHRQTVCLERVPELTSRPTGAGLVACHRADALAGAVAVGLDRFGSTRRNRSDSRRSTCKDGG